MRFLSRAAAGAAAITLCALSFVLPAGAQTYSVTLNGHALSFDVPPQEHGGRVFVPFRRIFEALGASVVYAAPQVNAQGNGRSVSLRVGSTTATVNGQTKTLESPPYIVGSRVMVPLRFVSENLGATVSYNDSTRAITINSGGSAPAPAAVNTVNIINRHPAPGSSVSTNQPTISGDFTAPVDPNSISLQLDGRTAAPHDFYNSARTFSYVPPQLTHSSHTIRVTGRSAAGVPFDRSWSFITGAAGGNSLRVTRPSEGQTVGASFTVSGVTAPGSQVTIVATSEANIVGGVMRITTGQQIYHTTADGAGNFSTQVALPAVPGGQVVIQLQSRAPSGASATARRTVHT